MVVATGGIAGCSRSGGTSPKGDVGGEPGTPLALPADVRSTNGRLAIDLVAAAAQVPWGSATRYALTYNGTTPGPTLRLRPGDELTVRLRNQLDRRTNLHTHGLHVSPEGSADNIFVMVDPGQEQTYEYRIPTDHPSGTFWYHPHHHGEVASQIMGGMAGAIVIEDDLDAAFSGAAERVLVLSDPKIGATSTVLTATGNEQQMGREGDVALVNGQLRPTIDAAAGTVERWRILNASPSRYYRLSVRGATMQLVATDGGRLDQPRPVADLLLTPGQRAEVLVTLDTVGAATLATSSVSRGGMGGMGMGGGSASATSPAADLLTVRVGPRGASTYTAPTTLRSIAPIDQLHVDNRRTVTLGAMGMGTGAFVIDGKGFAPDRTDINAKLGTTEEWTLHNNSMMDHPFHLHVWPFRVVSRSDGSPDPGWRDTVNVPAGGSVVIRVPFTDTPGRTVYHCHILDHEDLGMMGIIDVR
jgi:FtsP/CotA-like multicopper oxidase with cupredoxin domain